MTELRNIVKRRTAERCYSGRRLVVMLMPGDVIGLKEERCRKVFFSPLSRVYSAVVRWNVEAERIAKKKARQEKRRGER